MKFEELYFDNNTPWTWRDCFATDNTPPTIFVWKSLHLNWNVKVSINCIAKSTKKEVKYWLGILYLSIEFHAKKSSCFSFKVLQWNLYFLKWMQMWIFITCKVQFNINNPFNVDMKSKSLMNYRVLLCNQEHWKFVIMICWMRSFQTFKFNGFHGK